MALFDDLAKLLARLAPRGWAALLQQHGGGLDLTKPKGQLAAELQRPLAGVDRQHVGFEELCAEAHRAIEPGAPARSLLYHALASPDVHPLTNGAPTDADYPTLEELDLVENYIFSLVPKKLSDFRNPVIAVLACQYRTRPGAAHQKHADLAFARTGVARVGTEAARYRGAIRSFNPQPANGTRGFAAQPARYAAYIAEYEAVTAEHAVYRPTPLDSQFTFALPAHKLFAGTECLLKEDGGQMTVPVLRFAELHWNEKLARIHRAGPDNPGRVPPVAGFDLTAPPFVRNSKSSPELVKLVAAGDSVLLNPVPNPVVRIARQRVNGISQPVRFKVPKATSDNRFWSSLMLPAGNAGRAAPEYAHMRIELSQNAAGKWQQRDLNTIPEPPPAGQKSFEKKLSDGGYEAAHLIDQTCDGAVTLQPIAVLPLEILPAFSLVTAVDYFPQVDQADVIAWVEQLQSRPIGLSNPTTVFPQGGPEPLNDGRFQRGANLSLQASRALPNTQLPHPLNLQKPAFPASEAANLTATAIVGWAAAGQSVGQRPDAAGASSWLPDAASDYFAPGWDVSEHVVAGRSNYVSYGLGSPFPEDSKLCAALSSFWPAVAPDASRTYGFQPGGSRLRTSIPMLDSEVGYHAQHTRVLAGEVAASIGWDGDEGPFFETRGGQVVVNAVNPMRADQSAAALAGRLGFSGLDAVTTVEFIRRVEELIFCHKRVFPAINVTANQVWLVTAEQVTDWQTWASAVLPRAKPHLIGRGFIFEFARTQNIGAAAGNPPMRLTYQVQERVQVQLSTALAFWRRDSGAWQKIVR